MKTLLRFTLIMTLFLVGFRTGANAQIVSIGDDSINTDSVRRAFDDGPYFGLYKDNYFIVGVPVGEKITRQNSNIKFQISIAQRLTRSSLPFGTYLYLFYSQKCFWNIFEDSMPMTDLNFNPGIGLTKPLFVKGRFVGKVSLIAEHESNGRDGAASRSWNRISLAGSIMIDPHILVHSKVWLPIIDGSGKQRHPQLLRHLSDRNFSDIDKRPHGAGRQPCQKKGLETELQYHRRV